MFLFDNVVINPTFNFNESKLVNTFCFHVLEIFT